MNVLSETVKNSRVWELPYVKDLALTAGIKDLQERLAMWQKYLEKYGLKVSSKKMDVMVSGKVNEKICINDSKREGLNQVESFKYLGLVICEEEEVCEKDVDERIKVGWSK